MRRLPLTLKSASVAAASLFALVGVAVPTSANPAGASTHKASWHVQLNRAGTSAFEDVSCPSAHLCVAVGGGPNGRASIFRTANGGKSWLRESAPARTEALDWVSCPTSTYCLAAGLGPYAPIFLVSVDGGVTWATTGGPLGRDQFLLESLSCGSASVCVAASRQGFYHSTNGGATWLSPKVSNVSAVGPGGLACPTPLICFAAAGSHIFKSQNGGAAFDPIAKFPVGSAPLSVSCATATRCAAAGIGPSGTSVAWTVDGGRRWSTRAVPPSLGAIVGLSCPAPGTCTVVSKYRSATTRTILATASSTDRGVKWIVRGITSFSAVNWPDVGGGLACATSGSCFLDGFGIPTSSVFSSQATGASWRRAGVQPGLPPLSTVACPTAELCVAMGEQGLEMRSLDGGVTWTEVSSQLSIATTIAALSCPSATSCVAVGYSVGGSDVSLDQATPIAFRSTDGGLTWSPSTLPAGQSRLQQLTCATATVCVAIPANSGVSYLRSIDGGVTWHVEKLPNGDPTYAIAGISCGSATDCLAVGTSNSADTSYLSNDGGATWVAGAEPSGLYPVAVSCTSGLSCFAVGFTGLMAPEIDVTGISSTTDGGKHWTVQPAPTTWNEMSIDCVATRCEELATTSPEDGAVVSTVSTGVSGPSGLGWSTASLVPPDVVLSCATYSPSGRWIVVGSNAINGPLVISTT